VKVLLVGSGGREHALGWKLAASDRVTELISLPGNPGLAELGSTVEGVNPANVGAVAQTALTQGVDLVVVGPEAPLAAGLTDAVANLGIPVFGPSRAAARLEASKSFCKDVMMRAEVPTARAWTFDTADPAHRHVDSQPGPYVVKADGLAAGKGVLVTGDRSAAHGWVDRCFGGGFGAAGERIVIEEYLDGPEVSVFAVCSGTDAVALQPARDYKRLADGDRGPNTGGMGSYSPVTDLPNDLVDTAMATVIKPTLARMAEDGNPYTGFLYAGLVLTTEGPMVLEFNVRLGDPETQVVLPLMETDLVDLLEGALAGRVPKAAWSSDAAVEVVLAAQGYPESPVKGSPIKGLGQIPEDILVFHAGTKGDDGRLTVDGGRVLDLVAVAPTLAAARERVYRAVGMVSWPGVQYRSDIADTP
jgi:phosphoribosylamine--glycine ligase